MASDDIETTTESIPEEEATPEGDTVTDEDATTEEDPTPKKPTILELLKEVVGEERVSDSELERLIYSGDPSVLPQFHYRWKGKYLADFAVRVENQNEIEGILKIAREYNIPVIPRGGASSCMSSSSPTRGGITLDIKPMNKILKINKKSMFVQVEPGVTFERLEIELEKDGLALGIYPSSAKSAVIGGWIACGGRGGIGTPYYGGLEDNIISLSVVGGDGSVQVLEGDDINLFLNSYGILGVIFEIKMRIHKIVREYRSFSYGFSTLEGLCSAMVDITQLESSPVYLKIADDELQKYSNPLEKPKYVLSVTYPVDSSNTPSKDLNKIDPEHVGVYISENPKYVLSVTHDEDPFDIILEDLNTIAANHVGVYISDEFSKKEWDLRYDCEFNPKMHTETLMFQEFWVPVEKVFEMLSVYESYRRSHKIPALWFGMLGTKTEMRLNLMSMIDATHYLKFIASKGILHKMMKKAIKIGGEPYTIGLQNSIYMSRANPERLIEMQEAKEKWDPKGIMNPDRITSCLTSYRRIDILFVLAAAFRRFSRYVGK